MILKVLPMLKLVKLVCYGTAIRLQKNRTVVKG